MPENKSKSIKENKMLLCKMVYAINKAITQDILQDMHDNHLETNNRRIFIAGDYINDNLRQYVVKDYVELIPFNRHSWEGRIIVDRANKITYTISTYRTLKTIITKHRNHPHYLMGLLYVENGDCEGSYKQLTLGDYDPEFKTNAFDDEVLDEDFDRIMGGSISRNEGYKHYIIVYTADHHAITEIELLLLDRNFLVVDKLDLIEYVTPDFAILSENQFVEAEQSEEIEGRERPALLKLRAGVKPSLKSIEEEA